jgi:nucleoside-diphosphate kinase
MERTLSIVKPDAVAAGHAGSILAQIEEAGLRIVAMKLTQLTRERAERFYEVHKDRPFYRDLVAFMTSGAVVVSVLEADDAIARYRTLMGDTDSTKAAPGTIRARFGTDIERNASHGSDAPATAATEVAFFFEEGDFVSPVAPS